MTDLSSFVTAERIIMGLSATTTKEILEHLTGPLCGENGNISDADLFLADLLKREAEFTTAMENGVAIPHARSTAVRRLGMTIGIASGEGMLFNPESEQKYRLFFCIAIPTTAPTSHLPLLRLLAKFARDPKRVDKMLQFKTAAAIARNLAAFKG